MFEGAEKEGAAVGCGNGWCEKIGRQMSTPLRMRDLRYTYNGLDPAPLPPFQFMATGDLLIRRVSHNRTSLFSFFLLLGDLPAPI